MLERFSFTSMGNLSSMLPSCVKKEDVCHFIFINSEQMSGTTFPIIMCRPTVLRFRFAHPSMKSCNEPVMEAVDLFYKLSQVNLLLGK